MFLRQFFQQVLYGLYTTTQLDIEIDKKEKELQALPSAIDGVYESADMFDGLGKVAGGYEEQHKELASRLFGL